MKLSKLYRYAAFLSLFIVLSCYDDGIEEEPPINEINILTIGDSRVQGNRPYHESYRYELWKSLIESDWTVDFLGPNTDQAEYPEGRLLVVPYATSAGCAGLLTLSRATSPVCHGLPTWPKHMSRRGLHSKGCSPRPPPR